MSCLLSLSFDSSICYDAVGGYKNIYFINGYGQDYTFGTASGEVGQITTMPADVTEVFKYALAQNTTTNTYTNVSASSDDNLTTVYTHTTTFNVVASNPQLINEMRILAKTRPTIAIETNAGEILMVGIESGNNCAVTYNTGAAKADMKGFSISATAIETIGPVTLTDTAKAAFLALVVE